MNITHASGVAREGAFLRKTPSYLEGVFVAFKVKID
jgi:hypothetical protein